MEKLIYSHLLFSQRAEAKFVAQGFSPSILKEKSPKQTG